MKNRMNICDYRNINNINECEDYALYGLEVS